MSAPSPSSDAARTVAVVVDAHDVGEWGVPNPLVTPYVFAATIRLQRAGFSVGLVGDSAHQPAGWLAERLANGGFAGVLATSHLAPSTIEQIRASGLPVVWLDNAVWEPQRCVRRDETRAGEIVADAAADLGYERVVLVQFRGPSSHHSHQQRVAGVTRTLNRRQVPFERLEMAWQIDAAVFGSLFLTFGSRTAVICTDYFRLEYIYLACAMQRLSPGLDFELLCCDDASIYHRLAATVTRASFDRGALARQAVDMLLRCIGDPAADCPSILETPTLIPGSAAPGAHRRVA